MYYKKKIVFQECRLQNVLRKENRKPGMQNVTGKVNRKSEMQNVLGKVNRKLGMYQGK